jgi:hypothetical protein
MVVMFSDFLAPLERLDRHLAALAACGHEVTIFQIADPAELTLGLEQPVLLEDAESQRTLYVDPAVARAGYIRRYEEHGEALRAICRRLGVTHHRVVTDRPLELALFDFLQERMRRGRQFRRARNPGAA